MHYNCCTVIKCMLLHRFVYCIAFHSLVNNDEYNINYEINNYNKEATLTLAHKKISLLKSKQTVNCLGK